MPDPELETVELRRRGGELRIVLNRPETMNAWNTQLGVDLLAAVERAADDDVRAVVRSPARAAASPPGADLKAGFDPTAGGPPGRRHARCASATTRSSPASGGWTSPCSPRSTAPPSASGSRSRSRATW